jgi:hypothetical protein
VVVSLWISSRCSFPRGLINSERAEVSRCVRAYHFVADVHRIETLCA